MVLHVVFYWSGTPNSKWLETSMSNLVTTVVVHASTRDGGRTRLCRRSANTMMDHQVSDRSVTCGNCLRMIGRAHAEALELHADFLLGVAQAEAPAELLGRPEGLDTMSDTMLSDEILWARSELKQADRVDWMAGCARRLITLKLERDFRIQDTLAELVAKIDEAEAAGDTTPDGSVILR